MPNLRTWSEAQLKRGYSKAQIKKHLARKGYPLKVVAEVDKLKASTDNRAIPYEIPILIVVMLVVISLVAGYYAGTATLFSAENKEQQLIQQISEGESLTGTQQQFPNSEIDILPGHKVIDVLFAHTIPGQITDVNQTSFSFRGEQDTVTTERNPTMVYFMVINGTYASVAPEVVGTGDNVTVTVLTFSSTDSKVLTLVKIFK